MVGEESPDHPTVAEEGGDVCRFCMEPGEAGNPLYSPCACSGSIKFVHKGCLVRWFKHNRSPTCKVCKHEYSVSRVYAENAPARLPFGEFLVEIVAQLGCPVLICIWLQALSAFACLIWCLTFARSLYEALCICLRFWFTEEIPGYLLFRSYRYLRKLGERHHARFAMISKVLREIVDPIVSVLVTVLLHEKMRVIFPAAPWMVDPGLAWPRHLFVGVVCLSCVVLVTYTFYALLKTVLTAFHDTIRDDRYLITRLYNFGDDPRTQGGANLHPDDGPMIREQGADGGLRFRRANDLRRILDQLRV